MFKIRFYVLSFGLIFAYDLGAPSPKITDSDTVIDSGLKLQSQLQNYSKASITIAYAVMVARVEGGGDGRPTPTIIEIDLVRKMFHGYNHPDDPRELFISLHPHM